MSDLFTRLAARSQGEARRLEPRLPGLFEPGLQEHETFVEQTELSPAPAAAAAIEKGAVPADPHPLEPEERKRKTTPLSKPSADDDTTAAPAVARPGPEIRTDVPPPREEPLRREQFTEHHETRHEHRFYEERLVIDDADPPPVNEAAAVTAIVPERRPDNQAARSEYQPSPLRAALSDVPLTPDPLSVPQAQDMPATQPSQAPPERHVEVRIGHLEIRPEPPRLPPVRKRASTPSPAPDLNSYLGRRS